MTSESLSMSNPTSPNHNFSPVTPARPCLVRRTAQAELQDIHMQCSKKSISLRAPKSAVDKLKDEVKKQKLTDNTLEHGDYFTLGQRRMKTKSTLPSPPILGDGYRGRNEIRTKPRSSRSRTPVRVVKVGRFEKCQSAARVRDIETSRLCDRAQGFPLSPLRESIDPFKESWTPLSHPPAVSVKAYPAEGHHPPTINFCHTLSPPIPSEFCSPAPPAVQTDHVQGHLLPLTPNSVLVKEKGPAVKILRDVLTHSKTSPPSLSPSISPSSTLSSDCQQRHHQRQHKRIRQSCSTSAMIGVDKLLIEGQMSNNWSFTMLEDGPLMAVGPRRQRRKHIRSCDQVGAGDFAKCHAAQYVSAMCEGYN